MIYNPKTAFGNLDLIKWLDKMRKQQEEKDLIAQCKLCDSYGRRDVECEECEGRGHIEVKCDHA